MIPTHKGVIVFPDLSDMKPFDRDIVLDSYEKFTDVEAIITKHPKTGYTMFLCDLPNWEDGWGGNFKCFLYDDKKILGKWHYLKEAGLPDQSVEGNYYMDKRIFTANALLLEDGIPKWGLYIELEKI